MAGWIVHRPDRPSPWTARFQPKGGRAVSKSFRLQGEAKKWLAAQVTNKARGEFVDPRAGASTVADWSQVWMKGRRVRASTAARDASVIKSLVIPYLGKKPLGRVTAPILRTWVVDLEKAGKSPATIRKAFQLVGAMFDTAVRDGRLVRSPAKYVELPAVGRKEMQFISAVQVANIAAVIDPRYRMLVRTAAFTGLRWGELAGLKASDLDLDVLRPRLRVVRTVNEVRGQIVIGEPKTAAGRRSVAVPRFLADELKAYLEAMTDPDGWVFPAPKGGPMRRNQFRRRVWEPATDKAGLKGFRFHDLRHTSAALLIAQGEHPKVIQSRLGHASISTTLDLYGHLLPGLDDAAAERLEGLGTAAADDVIRILPEISRTKPRTKRA